MAMICLVGTKLNHALLPVAFAFSAGTFLYVSLTHIVPEIGSNLKAWHLLAMLAGLLFPYFCFIEAEFPFCFEQTRSRSEAQTIYLSICKCHPREYSWKHDRGRRIDIRNYRPRTSFSIACHAIYSFLLSFFSPLVL